MRLSKEQEGEVRRIYQEYFDSYFRGDLEQFASCMADDIRIIGSSEIELLDSKEQVVAFYQTTTDDIAGKAEFRNRMIDVFPVRDLVLVRELCDSYVLVEDQWCFYSKLRITTFFDQTASGWKLVHQHASIPDSRAEGNETVSFENITRENRELRDAVKRRTQELEIKNRDLEIEAALERIRTISMTMQNASDLASVAQVIFAELKNLGFEDLRNSEVVINSDSQQTITSYYYSDYGVTGVVELDYSTNPIVKNWAEELQKADDAFAQVVISSDEIDDWRTYRESVGYLPDPKLGNVTDLYYYSYSTGLGALSISSFSQVSAEQLNILQRFRNVFALAYQRFTEISKAQVRAREAQLEMSLERVRAKSMQMQHSSELNDLSKVFHEQLLALGIDSEFSFVWLPNEEEENHMFWTTWAETSGSGRDFHTRAIVYPLNKSEPYTAACFADWESGVPVHEHFVQPKDIKTFFASWEEMLEGATNLKAEYFPDGIFYTEAFMRYGCFGIDIRRPLTNEEKSILHRFAIEFERAYTRFIDLQKSEAQAREAEIELALERVRASTMAMHASEDLSDVATVLFEQMGILGGELFSFGIVLCDKHEDMVEQWHSIGSQGMITPFLVPIDLDHIHRYRYDQWKAGEELFSIEIPEDYIDRHFELMFELPSVSAAMEEVRSKGAEVNVPGWEIDYGASFNHGYLLVSSLSPFEEKDIFPRFAKVFEQAYTRFLDLQKAEAQAREAQVEAALERVRSRSMGMRSSEELKEVIQLVYEQFVQLNINVEHTGFIVDYKDSDDMHIWLADENEVPSEITIPYFDSQHWNDYIRAKANGGGLFTTLLSAEETNTFYRELFQHIPGTPEAVKEFYYTRPGLAGTTVLLDTVGLYIENFSAIPYSESDNDVVMRFGKVFQQTYTRFKDLQKAEAQAREAQIETALERVRSRTMSMHKSEELREVIQLVFDEFIQLNIPIDHTGILPDYRTRDDMHIWLADRNGVTNEIVLPYFKSAHWDGYLKTKAEGGGLFTVQLQAEETQKYYRDMFKFIDGLSEEIQEFYFTREGLAISTVLLDSVGLYVENYSGIPYTNAENDVVMRFGKVFQQTYTRFQDLQRAEAQARESQIEIALERVRNRAISMRSSDELADLVITLFRELRNLDMVLTRCLLWIFNPEDKSSIVWMANSENPDVADSYFVPYHEHPAYMGYLDAWENLEPGWEYLLEGEDKDNWDEELVYGYFASLPENIKWAMKEPDRIMLSCSFNKYGCIQTASMDSLSEANLNILHRFSQVFEQSYTRFLDLVTAEAQAREAQVELALERIRAQVTAMKESSDLLDIVVTMRAEFIKLGHEAHYFWHMRWLPDIYQKAMTSGDGTRIGMVMELPRHIHGDIPLLSAWEKGTQPTVVYAMDAEAAVDYVNKMVTLGDFQQIDPQAPGEDDIRHIGGLTFIMARTTHGEIGFSLPGPVQEPPEESLETLVRFAGVFDLAYKRFEDLKQSEKRKREAEIDLGLEKLRSRTMAMQQSHELPEVANLMFLEIQRLGIPAWSCGFNILAEDQQSSVCLMSSEGTLQKPFVLPFTGEASFLEWMEFLKSDDDLFIQELKGDAIEQHYGYMKSLPELVPIFEDLVNAGLSLPTYQINHLVKFTHGFLLFITYEEVADAHDIFKRFTKVFEQTYTRFLDLKNMEVQAHEAKIETALERVRARALAMQVPEELKDVAKVLRHEMGMLGIEELETSSIYINDKETGQAECWYAIKDLRAAEKVLVADHFALNLNDTWVGREMQKFYESPENEVSIVMKGEARKEWIKYCELHSKALTGYYGEVIPERTYHLYKFSHGAIGVATPGDLSQENWGLLRRAASVFSLAYSRFKDLRQAREDLEKLKEEKQRAEHALRELKLTQKQLVHAEKMASLGELTAGIAHEIQNPLNFVNNFSEVSKELLEELIEEFKNGDAEEVNAIAADVVQNLEKIAHHGKRADSIVKGMLQHSRSSDGIMQRTDLNLLVDEYLRLAYHGLRARDKSFNANMETDFDKSIGKIDLVPQDVGRVILNLVTNAFYAVTEKKASATAEYQPTVTVVTCMDDTAVEVQVKDNGNGIPSHVIDKIFQPFFTTKPTGQGTGLGLSMSYDIITKGHGGELKVVSEVGMGTTFTVTIPLNKS